MIGFFDSGFGGVQTLKYFRELYPDLDYLFLADGKNCPYGNKTGEEIQTLTFQHLHRLFDQGAKIVILACNTAAAYSVRAWQNQFPDKKVLSITIPGVERILEHISPETGTKKREKTEKKIGILATQATVLSGIYTDLFFRLGGHGNPDFHFVMAPALVDLVERGEEDPNVIREQISLYLGKFTDPIDALVLGCTHFPVLMKYFREIFAGDIIDPSREAAKKFGSYLTHHPEIAQHLSHNGTLALHTTGDTQVFEKISEKILQ